MLLNCLLLSPCQVVKLRRFRMFNRYDDEYIAATEYASINTYDEKKKNDYKLGIFNLFLLTTIGLMGYVGFDSLKKKSTITDSNEERIEVKSSDSEYLDMLRNMDVDNLDIPLKRQINLTDALNDIVNRSDLKDDSLYTQNIAKEVDKRQKIQTIIVQKGDTLASLSEQYYGDAMAFDKIILANNALSLENSIIYVGQEIVLP